MDELTFAVLKIVISVCAALITAYVIPYIKTLKDDARYAKVIDMIRVAVAAAEQTITNPKSGRIKKEKVVGFIKDWLANQNLDITDGQLDELIEAAVWQMKQGE